MHWVRQDEGYFQVRGNASANDNEYNIIDVGNVYYTWGTVNSIS